jgi:restriction endonuclease Mrr
MASLLTKLADEYKGRPLEHIHALAALINDSQKEIYQAISVSQSTNKGQFAIIEIDAQNIRAFANEIDKIAAAELYPGMCSYP